MPAQLYWSVSGGTKPKTVLILCLHLITWAEQAAEPAQSSGQPCQWENLAKECSAVVSCPVFTLSCGHLAITLNPTTLIKT